MITNVYGPNDLEPWNEFFAELLSIISHFIGSCCMIVHFNIILSIREKNTMPTSINEMLKSRSLVSELQLIEIPLKHRCYT